MKRNVPVYAGIAVALAAGTLIYVTRFGGQYGFQPPAGTTHQLTQETGQVTEETVSNELRELERRNKDRLIQGCFGGRDCIPSIDKPKFISARHVGFLKDDDFVIGLFYGDEARAYPIKILDWHEIVNDTVGGTPIAVTYCPLCRTGIAYERVLDGVEVEFGVSGQLLNSNLVMYDRKTETLWSQITGEAVSGPKIGSKLKKITVLTAHWKDWLEEYPGTKVLSTDTGFIRDYEKYPYGDYETNPAVYFPLEHEDSRLPSKTVVYGVEVFDKAKAYPEEELRKALPDGGELDDSVGGHPVKITYDKGAFSVKEATTGEEIIPQISFWFAWAAFYPETEIYTRQSDN